MREVVQSHHSHNGSNRQGQFDESNNKAASEYMNSAGFGTFGCEMAFGVSKSPISDSNDYESKAAAVAGAIAGLLPGALII